MATLPRMYSQRANIVSPFSTSPRQLQEMTSLDGHADLTTSSGMSIKQYEEQLNGLRKDNFHLKLRVYFLEEKLGSGSPPAVQGLLEHNVRLQVELEELKKQLTDKHQLLAAAAEAIDVLEQQGSVSMDSEECLNGAVALKRRVEHLEEQIDEKQNEIPDVELENKTDLGEGDNAVCSTLADQDELLKLRREHHKALQMIKSCMKRIQQQEKQIKRLEALEPTPLASELDADKYEEMLRCKDQQIVDLQQKLKEIQTNETADNSSNLQELLTKRLQGLAYFLDKLLSNKCVLGEEKKKLAESLLEQSLALPVGLKLDESMAPGDLTMDESNFDISHSLRIEDLTLMFGHHVLSDEVGRISARKPFRTDLVTLKADPSESECWSEPDRNVSLARIGLNEVASPPKVTSSEEQRHKARRSRGSHAPKLDETRNSYDTLRDEVERLKQQVETLEISEKDLQSQLETAEQQIQNITSERDNLAISLKQENDAAALAISNEERTALKLQTVEAQKAELEARLELAVQTVERLRNERFELETAFAETECSLRRAADEAALQASHAALDRARAQHERLRVERELEQTQQQLEEARELGGALPVALACVPRSDDERPTSPDQGIDSDRLSSLEHAESATLSPRSLYAENLSLKQKLASTKATLVETLTQLNAANQRKRSMQRAICREIHKTHGVLRQARDHLEHNN